jgi:hypothetical protein
MELSIPAGIARGMTERKAGFHSTVPASRTASFHFSGWDCSEEPSAAYSSCRAIAIVGLDGLVAALAGNLHTL